MSRYTEIEVTEENRLKLVKYARHLFKQHSSDDKYPYARWESQFDEIHDLYRNGRITQQFLDSLDFEAMND